MDGDFDLRLRPTTRPTGRSLSSVRLLVLLALLPVLILGTAHVHHARSDDGPVWMSGGPAGGYVTSLAFAPSDPGVAYAGTVVGVHVSRNGGESWSATGLRELVILAVRVDPEDPDLVYALAEEGTTSGLHRSTNGGEDWTRLGPDGVQALDIDPSNAQVLWVGTDTGHVHRSTDRGESWSLLLHKQYSSWSMGQDIHYDHPITSVLVDPEESDRVFLALGRGGGDEFGRTDDGGETWEFSRVGRLSPGQARDLAVTPAGYAPQALFVISSGDSSVGYSDSVYRSLDQGDTWQMLAGHVGSTLVVDPNAPDQLLLGTTSTEHPLVMLDHTDSSWSDASAGLPRAPFMTWASPDAVAVSPDGSGVAYAGFRRGRLYQSLDGGRTWELPPGGIHNYDAVDLAISPSDPVTALASGGGLFGMERTDDAGASWSVIENSPDHAGRIAIDPTNEARMFVGAGFGPTLHRSEDGGATWTRIDEGSFSGPFRDIWIHPERPEIVLTLKDEREDERTSLIHLGGVRRSSDGGASWTQVRNWWRPATLAHDPNDPDVVYLGLARLGYVERSTNAGLTWTNISPQAEWAGTVNDLVVGSDSNVYAATTDHGSNEQGGIWRWDGAQWSRLVRFDATEVTALAIDRNTDPDTLYAGTKDQGVLVSEDGGASWSALSVGLEVLHITRLELSTTRPSMLYAGLRHGGVWSVSVDRPPSEVPSEAPSVTITGGPEGVVGETSAEFTFVADVEGASFECRLDAGAWEGCASPVVYTGLADGSYTFQVRATAGGLTGEVASRTWTVTLPLPAVACPPGEVPVAPFTDVSRTGTHTAAIDCAVWYGIAQGRTPTSYAPAVSVNRAQMASFVARLIEAGGGTLPPAAPQGFTDLDQAGVHAERINQLAAAGVVRGTSPTTYAPTASVTRAQMATFLVNAYEFVADTQLPAAPSSFLDIGGNTHETNIEKAAAAGFARGTTTTTYAPADHVRRDQMASFLTRVLDRFAGDGNSLHHLD